MAWVCGGKPEHSAWNYTEKVGQGQKMEYRSSCSTALADGWLELEEYFVEKGLLDR